MKDLLRDHIAGVLGAICCTWGMDPLDKTHYAEAQALLDDVPLRLILAAAHQHFSLMVLPIDMPQDDPMRLARALILDWPRVKVPA